MSGAIAARWLSVGFGQGVAVHCCPAFEEVGIDLVGFVSESEPLHQRSNCRVACVAGSHHAVCSDFVEQEVDDTLQRFCCQAAAVVHRVERDADFVGGGLVRAGVDGDGAEQHGPVDWVDCELQPFAGRRNRAGRLARDQRSSVRCAVVGGPALPAGDLGVATVVDECRQVLCRQWLEADPVSGYMLCAFFSGNGWAGQLLPVAPLMAAQVGIVLATSDSSPDEMACSAALFLPSAAMCWSRSSLMVLTRTRSVASAMSSAAR